jgi:hypothetical protein
LVKAVSSAVSNSSAITIYNFKNVCMWCVTCDVSRMTCEVR